MGNILSQAFYQYYCRYTGEDGLFYTKSFYSSKMSADLIKKLYDIFVLNIKELCKHCDYEYISHSNYDKILFYKYPSFEKFPFTLDQMVADWETKHGFIQPLVGTNVNNTVLLSEGRHRIQVVKALSERNQEVNPAVLCIYKNTFDKQMTNMIIPKEVLDTIYPILPIERTEYDDFSYICQFDGTEDLFYIYFMFQCELDNAFEKYPGLLTFDVDTSIINKKE